MERYIWIPSVLQIKALDRMQNLADKLLLEPRKMSRLTLKGKRSELCAIYKEHLD